MPALVEAYAVRFASPSTARVEISTMRPCPAAFIAGSVACTRASGAARCRFASACRSSSATCSSGFSRMAPALWTTVVIASFAAISSTT
jgi:hypothetical protein